MLLLRSIVGLDVSPSIIFNVLRLVFFCFSFVLEDWALHDLIDSRRQRRTAILLIASSYVTWTWQAHTFSNGVETAIVLWTLVLAKRLQKRASSGSSDWLAAAVLAFLCVFGVFNRITFAVFVFIPLLQLAPTVLKRPSLLVVLAVSAALTTVAAILTDTSFYTKTPVTLNNLLHSPIVTPINNLRYNTDASNLALHGHHPVYQHLLVNLPQLLGPALVPLLLGMARLEMPLTSGIFGALALSIFPHQEARFLLPAIPLILSCTQVPHRFTKTWISAWIIFNLLLGVLMGVYHQGGVVPAQMYLATEANVTQAFWWKTYSPPRWLLGARAEGLRTIDLMGLQKDALQDRICMSADEGTVLVAPTSADFLDQYLSSSADENSHLMQLEQMWRYSKHLNLDDMDFGDDGVLPTLRRVVDRKEIAVWKVSCPQARKVPEAAAYMQRDW